MHGNTSVYIYICIYHRCFECYIEIPIKLLYFDAFEHMVATPNFDGGWSPHSFSYDTFLIVSGHWILITFLKLSNLNFSPNYLLILGPNFGLPHVPCYFLIDQTSI